VCRCCSTLLAYGLYLLLRKTLSVVLRAFLSREHSWADVCTIEMANAMFFKAVKANDYHGVLKAAVEMADVDRYDHDGYTALHHAVVGGNKEIVKFLIDCGAKLDAKVQAGRARRTGTRGQTATAIGFPFRSS
jgi:Ankyrin repeats (3 copies)